MPGQVGGGGARPQAGGVFLIGLEGFADPAVLAPWPHEFVRDPGGGTDPRRLTRTRLRGPRAGRAGAAAVAARSAARMPRARAFWPASAGRRLPATMGCWPLSSGCSPRRGSASLGAHEILDEALGPAGLLSHAAPDAVAMADIRRGIAVARALGAIDVGQGCVVQQGIVLAVEAAEGTDAMLARCGALARAGARRGAGEAGEAGPGPPHRPADRRARDGALARRRPDCGGLRSRPGAPFWPSARPRSPRRTRPGCSCWVSVRKSCSREGEST